MSTGTPSSHNLSINTSAASSSAPLIPFPTPPGNAAPGNSNPENPGNSANPGNPANPAYPGQHGEVAVDLALAMRAREGDVAALGRILEQYQHRLYNLCLRMVGNRDDAAEVAQDAMLKIVQHISDYNGQSAIYTWMARIAINLCISHLRKRRLRHTASLDADGHPGQDDQTTPLRQQIQQTGEPSPQQSVQQREMIAHLRLAMDRLDDDFRAVLTLRDLQEMDCASIAQVLSVPVGTVKSRLFRARLALRHQMLKLSPPAGRTTGQDEGDVGG